VLGLIAFNIIMQVVNAMYAPAVLGAAPDKAVGTSMVSSAMYMLLYASFVVVLANSAFKAIDMIPNMVMGWIGQRFESRVEDAQMVQTTAMGSIATAAMMRGYVSAPGTGNTQLGTAAEPEAYKNSQPTDVVKPPA
jgi:hypothetical protein